MPSSLYRQLQGGTVDGHRLQMLALGCADPRDRRFIAHADAHKHGGYIVANADLPGFSGDEQRLLSLLVLGQSGGLRKLQAYAPPPEVWSMILCLRLGGHPPAAARRSSDPDPARAAAGAGGLRWLEARVARGMGWPSTR